MKVVPFRKGVRYLGVNWSPGFDRDDASASVRRVVDRFLGCLGVPMAANASSSLRRRARILVKNVSSAPHLGCMCRDAPPLLS